MTDPQFGQLTDVFEGHNAPARLWQFEVQAEAFAEMLRVALATTDELGITSAHRVAFKDFIDNQHSYKRLALEAILEFYQTQIIPLAIEEGFTEVAPPVSTLNELEALLSYPGLYVHSPKDGVCLLGLEFECEWDAEHGTGVLFGNGKVLKADIGHVAFMG